MQRLLEELPARRLAAIETAKRRTGLPFHGMNRLVVTIRDARALQGFAASSRLVRSERDEIHLVSLSAEQIVLGIMDVDASLVHESIHCIMRDLMGDRPYRALPRWVREGIAVWGADQLDERAREVVARAFLDQRDPRAVLREVGDLENPPDYYLMVALAFEYLSYNHGQRVVRAIIADIVDGTRPDRAFEKYTGLPMKVIEQERRTFSRMYFEQVLNDSGLLEYQEAERWYALGYPGRAVDLLMAMAVYRPDALLQADAWHRIGQLCYEQERYPQAALAFNVVIANFPERIGLRRDSRVWLRKCSLRMNQEQLLAVRTVLTEY
jgi:tetratricopeptide (TPR) repeat protein